MKNAEITVFTPTFNRAYCLGVLYESLCRQTSKSFRWLVIDDGSTDHTKKLIEKWDMERKVAIQYIYKDNGGMHTAHNVAYNNINTELNICIDSDDYLLDDAIENILKFWAKNKASKFAGLVGLNIFKNGNIVSNKIFPTYVEYGKYGELKSKYGLMGDIKFIYRTEVIKKYPEYPIFENEKFVPLGYKYLLIDQDYDLLFLNMPLCVVEYLPDGSTKNIISQYFKNPLGFSHERKIRMVNSFSFKEKITNTIHYVTSSIISKNTNFIIESPRKILTICCVPAGVLLFILIYFRKVTN